MRAPLQAAVSRGTSLLERGQASLASDVFLPLLKSGLTREEEVQLRCLQVEALVMQGELAQAATTLGRSPETLREPLPPVLVSTLWRLHGRIAFARGEQSRAIALHQRALKQAEAAHDSRSIGLARYELALCYQKVGDLTIVREHIGEAAAALHAAGDRRHLALVHSLSGVVLAQASRYEESNAALRQAERQAAALAADDVLAIVCRNQANVALFRHRYEQALALAERAVALQESLGETPGLAGALATLGQICVPMGNLSRAEQVLQRALGLRSGALPHETAGAIYDTLAQVSLMRGDYENAAEYLRRAADAYGAYGQQTSRWYEWSVRVISARLAIRRARPDEALAMADEVAHSPAAPPSEALEAELIAVEALLAAERVEEADQRLRAIDARLDRRRRPAAWGEFLRLRGSVQLGLGHTVEAYHDIAQSASVFELVGERYQAASSQLELGKLAARSGARSTAERHFSAATDIFGALGATVDLEQVAQARQVRLPPVNSASFGSFEDANGALVQRLVEASIMPELLARELAAVLLSATAADAVAVFTHLPSGEVRVLAAAGLNGDAARSLALTAVSGGAFGAGFLVNESLGRDNDGSRRVVIASGKPIAGAACRLVRTLTAVASQGFELCAAREQPPAPAEAVAERPLEPVLPGFICASAAMARVADQIQRLQGNDLTVLITGESGTGKELVAQAIHKGSIRNGAAWVTYNCTSLSRELADSQLFGHRRGAFTNAHSDQIGLVRSASGGTLFLDEAGDLPLEVQPKLLRFLEQGEVMPVGDTRPQRVDVRVVAATNADLEQRVAEGKFREDLYYRLSVIRIHVPPLRKRREEIPHLSTFFMREAAERFGKPDVRLGSDVLEIFSQYWWPGNVRQLRNEVQRVVAMAAPRSVIGVDHLSPELMAETPERAAQPHSGLALAPGQSLAALVDDVERDVIQRTLATHRGNISESARELGLTRRGLYLKLKRLGLEASA